MGQITSCGVLGMLTDDTRKCEILTFDRKFNLRFRKFLSLRKFLRETVFLAIKLNRTVVPPPFYKHDRTDDSKDEGILSSAIFGTNIGHTPSPFLYY